MNEIDRANLLKVSADNPGCAIYTPRGFIDVAECGLVPNNWDRKTTLIFTYAPRQKEPKL